MVKVIFKERSSIKTFDIDEHRSILDLSKGEKDINIEGSCQGEMACSTCHILIDEEWVDKLPSPCIDEKEMLSLLPNYCRNSRLGCQIVITKDLNGLQFCIPEDK